MAETSKIIKLHVTADRLSGLIGYQMRRAQLAIQADLSETLAEFDLRMITFSALSVIAENVGLRQSQLADALLIERPNLVVIIDELEERELIRRKQVPTDRRAYALHITKEGTQVLNNAFKAVEAHEARVFDELSTQDQKELHSMLATLAVKESKR